jgi:hypothetical protein
MRVKKNAAKLNVVHRLDAEIDVRSDDVVRFARGDHQVDAIERVSYRDVVERDAEKGYRETRRFVQQRGSRGGKHRRLSIAGDNGCGGDLLVGPHVPSERAWGGLWNGDSNLSRCGKAAK